MRNLPYPEATFCRCRAICAPNTGKYTTSDTPCDTDNFYFASTGVEPQCANNAKITATTGSWDVTNPDVSQWVSAECNTITGLYPEDTVFWVCGNVTIPYFACPENVLLHGRLRVDNQVTDIYVNDVSMGEVWQQLDNNFTTGTEWAEFSIGNGGLGTLQAGNNTIKWKCLNEGLAVSGNLYGLRVEWTGCEYNEPCEWCSGVTGDPWQYLRVFFTQIADGNGECTAPWPTGCTAFNTTYDVAWADAANHCDPPPNLCHYGLELIGIEPGYWDVFDNITRCTGFGGLYPEFTPNIFLQADWDLDGGDTRLTINAIFDGEIGYLPCDQGDDPVALQFQKTWTGSGIIDINDFVTTTIPMVGSASGIFCEICDATNIVCEVEVIDRWLYTG